MEPVMLLSMAERFAAAVRQHNIRVLLVHGKQDALVPVSNSRRLAALLGCRLIEVERCGHQPQEEMPDEFVKWVADFMEQPRDERFPSADANL
jgi:pimeloyl-ACP methyl ester carboxylesterase